MRGPSGASGCSAGSRSLFNPPSSLAMDPTDRVTELLVAAGDGDAAAFDELFPLVYDGSRVGSSPASGRATRSPPPTSSTRPTSSSCAWTASRGKAARSSSPSPLARCGTSSSTMRSGERPRSAVEGTSESRWGRSRRGGSAGQRRAGRARRARAARGHRRAAEPRGRVPLLRRNEHRGDRGGSRHLARLDQARDWVLARAWLNRELARGGA